MTNMSRLLLVALITILATSELIPFGEKAVNAIFKEKRNALILFVESDAEGQQAQSTFKELASNSKDQLVYTFIEKGVNADHFSRFGDYLGFPKINSPFLVYLAGGRQKYIADLAEFNAENIQDFIAKAVSGQLKPFLKSAPIPEDKGEAVRTLVGKNYREVINGDDKEYLVKIYAPWCTHCKTIAPHFVAAAEALRSNPNIVLAEFDGTLNEVDGLISQGYPTIYFYGRDKTAEPIAFNGQRDTQGIIQWLQDHTEHEWVEPIKAGTAETGQEEL